MITIKLTMHDDVGRLMHFKHYSVILLPELLIFEGLMFTYK